MTTDLIIRPSQENDISAITAIYQKAVIEGTATFETTPPSSQEMSNRRQTLLNQHYPYLVAELDATVVGYAYAGPYNTRAAFHSTLENSIYIHPAYQQQRIGYKLLEQLINQSTQLSFRQMIAVIGDSHNTGSIKLHTQHGFKLMGTLPSVGWKHNRWLDVILMQRSLGKGDTTALENIK